MILCSTVFNKTYSQNIEAQNLKEINKFLAEGLECKELIVTKNSEIRVLDSIIVIKDSSEVQYKKEIKQKDKKVEAQNSYIDTVTQEYGKVNDLYKEELVKTKKEKQRKKFWRTTSLAEAGVLVVIIMVLLL